MCVCGGGGCVCVCVCICVCGGGGGATLAGESGGAMRNTERGVGTTLEEKKAKHVKTSYDPIDYVLLTEMHMREPPL